MLRSKWREWRTDLRVVLSNFLSLSVLEGVNFVLPLLTLPYLFRVLGPERFGLVAFAQVVMTWLSMIVGYGFNLSATRSVARVRDKRQERDELLTAVLACKCLLFLLAACILGTLLLAVGRIRDDADVFLVSFGLVLGNVLTLTWFFQGIERMLPLTAVSIICRVAVMLLTFAFVQTRDDYLMLAVLNSISAIAIGGASVFVACFWFRASLRKISLAMVLQQFRDGTYIFLTHFVSAFYLYIPPLLLGFLHGNTAVGIYTPAQRVVSVVSRMVGPLTASLFPFVSRVGASSNIAGGRLVGAIALSGGLALSLLCAVLCWFSGEIVGLIAGSQYPGAIAVFKVLIWLPVFGYLRRVITVLGMVNHSQEHLVFLLSNVGLLGGVVLILPLSVFYMELGTAAGLVITEACIAILSIYLFFFYRVRQHGPQIVEVKAH